MKKQNGKNSITLYFSKMFVCCYLNNFTYSELTIPNGVIKAIPTCVGMRINCPQIDFIEGSIPRQDESIFYYFILIHSQKLR